MRFGFPRIAFPLAIVLGPLMETSYFQTLRIGDGTSILFDRPQSIVIMLLIVGCIAYYLKGFFTRSDDEEASV